MAEEENINIAEFSAEVQKAFRDLKEKAEIEKEAISLADDLIAKLSGLKDLSSELNGKLKKIGSYAGTDAGTDAGKAKRKNVSKDRKEELWKEFKSTMKKKKWTAKDVRDFLKTKDLEPKNPIAFFGDLLNPEIDKTIMKEGERADRTYRFK
jgi:hypothetical protein